MFFSPVDFRTSDLIIIKSKLQTLRPDSKSAWTRKYRSPSLDIKGRRRRSCRSPSLASKVWTPNRRVWTPSLESGLPSLESGLQVWNLDSQVWSLDSQVWSLDSQVWSRVWTPKSVESGLPSLDSQIWSRVQTLSVESGLPSVESGPQVWSLDPKFGGRDGIVTLVSYLTMHEACCLWVGNHSGHNLHTRG